MSRHEVRECDLAKCKKTATDVDADGWVVVLFAGRHYDLCSSEHNGRWEDQLREWGTAVEKAQAQAAAEAEKAAKAEARGRAKADV